MFCAGSGVDNAVLEMSEQMAEDIAVVPTTFAPPLLDGSASAWLHAIQTQGGPLVEQQHPRRVCQVLRVRLAILSSVYSDND